ncbi:ABC transporter C member 13, variant 2 [Dionaea muscipula]
MLIISSRRFFFDLNQPGFVFSRYLPFNLVWEGHGFSECFDDMVFGLGGNLVTLIMIAVIAIWTRWDRRSRKTGMHGKFLLQSLPILQVGSLVLDMVLMWRNSKKGYSIKYYDLIFRCSRISVWVTVLLLSLHLSWLTLFCNWILCYWWILRAVSQVPHLRKTWFSSEALQCFQEGAVVLLDLMFGISINVIRIKQAALMKGISSSEEDPLLCDELDLEDGHHDAQAVASSFWHGMIFNNIHPVLDQGVKKQLDFEDLLALPPDMNPSSCHETLQMSWEAQQISNCSNASLLKAIWHSYGWPYFCLGLLKVCNDCVGFTGPLLLNKLIRYLQQGSGSLDGFGLAISLGLTALLKSLLDTQYTYRLSKLKLKLRSSIMTIIYEKCLYVSLAQRCKFSEGEIQTFMSVDADRTVNLFNCLHDMWSLPLQISIALYLLYTQVNFAFLSGVAITVLLIPVNKWISNLIASATEKMMKQKDERIRQTGELLTHIRTLKMYGWELLFTGWVMETRSSEVMHLSTRKYLDAWCVFFWATTPTLYSLFTFGLFTLMGHQLDAATVFTCLALFNTLISPLNSFPWVINGLIDAVISSRRLSRFLGTPECKMKTGMVADPLSQFCSSLQTDDKAVVIQKAYFSWSVADNEQHTLRLFDVSLSIPKASLVVVVGEVGSGKSSLLNAILGEMQQICGWVHKNGSVAYVPQVPWIFSGSIRDNIIFGKEYNPARYGDVIQACALDVDISRMIGGDMAYIGEKGANLSGGQRARLALARAMYHGADIYLLDDVLSAVDVHVARCILHDGILGPLMNSQARILCTHNLEAISSADIVVEMDKGHARLAGSSRLSSYPTFSSLIMRSPPNHAEGEGSCSNSSESEDDLHKEKVCIYTSDEAQEINDVEERKEGRVELTVYKTYAAFSGWFIAALILLSAVLMQASRNGNDLWLSYWVDMTRANNGPDRTLSFYVVVLSLFCLANSVMTLIRAFSFAFGGLQAAVRMHTTLLHKLVDASVQFFDRTPRGRILNRLSSDLYMIDDSLPFILNILLANCVGILGIAVVLSFVQVLFLALLLPFWYIYRKLQFYYRSTSRELRRLDSVSRSPIYASFTETLDGSSTIRAFNVEDFFFRKFFTYVATYQRTSYSELVASLWLSLRLQFLAAFIISFIGTLAVIGSHEAFPFSLGTPGLVGLALSYAAPIVSLLGSFLSSYTETEKEMVAVERVLQYMDLPQEDSKGSESLHPDWPFQGKIEFQSVTLKYLPSLPAALNDVTFTISAGTQVGIIGRTGAGKSSILNALFRLSPISGGYVLVDGINIADISVRNLRPRLAVVPQSPFLFQGSLRDNLDPFKKNDNLKIWDTLDKCHMKEEVERVGGLDITLNESGTFSVGQRQLLCLARAFLKSSKVLCLDECTANVDSPTASVLHRIISTECRGMTVITIAHRISTVLNMDEILVLEQGILVEQGSPGDLLQDEHSKFSAFTRASSMRY